MIEYFLEYKQELLRIFFIFCISLSMVYVFGRMLGIVTNFSRKNMIAIISNISMNTYFSIFFLKFDKLESLLWDIVLYSSFVTIIYVLVGFKLYDRVDNLLDKKIADDKKSKK